MTESEAPTELQAIRPRSRAKYINEAGVELCHNIDCRLWELSQTLSKQAVDMAEIRGDLKALSEDVQHIKDMQSRRMQFAQATLLSIIGTGVAAVAGWVKSWSGFAGTHR